MNFSRLALLSTALFALPAFAQSSNSSRKADDDWAQLVAATRTPGPATAPGARKTVLQLEKDRAARAAGFRQAASQAKNFYTAFPTHLYASEARKIEAVSMLLGVTDTDKSYEAAAAQAARNYRTTTGNPVEARFEVALLAERVAARKALGGDPFGSNSKELERIADSLALEFGNIEPVYNFYASIARAADMVTAERLARKIAQSPAGRDAQVEAQSILARQALLSKPLNWKLPEVDKKDPIDLAAQNGKPTLIYLTWYDEGAPAYPGLAEIKKTTNGRFRVIYLTLGATEAQARNLQKAAPVPGTYCYEPRGALGPAAEKFNVRQTPYVFVLNRTGTLAGFGPLSELSTLTQIAAR